VCVCLCVWLHFTVLLFFKICFSLCVCLSCYSFNCVCGCPWGEIVAVSSGCMHFRRQRSTLHSDWLHWEQPELAVGLGYYMYLTKKSTISLSGGHWPPLGPSGYSDFVASSITKPFHSLPAFVVSHFFNPPGKIVFGRT